VLAAQYVIESARSGNNTVTKTTTEHIPCLCGFLFHTCLVSVMVFSELACFAFGWIILLVLLYCFLFVLEVILLNILSDNIFSWMQLIKSKTKEDFCFNQKSKSF